MDLKLKGKVALITGSSEGIGLRTAVSLATEGCDVVLVARKEPALREAEKLIEAEGVGVAAIAADVTKDADAERIIRETIQSMGALDILINNVGGNAGGKLRNAVDPDWKRTFELNVFAAARLIRLAQPHMKSREGAAVVNVASISGWSPQLAGTPQYGASKAALIFLGEVLALELAPDNIRVNTVSPGSILIPGGGWDRVRNNKPDAFEAYVRDGFPMGRLGSPDEVADVITFLASPRSHWINGRNIPVDGLEQPVPCKGIFE